MRAVLRIVAIGVVLLGIAAAAPGQSLGELAKQEAERRKTVKSSGKVYTNDSVRPTEPATRVPAPAEQAAVPATPAPQTAVPPSPSGAQSGTAPAASGGQSGTPASVDETKTEAYWKNRITAEREGLARAQTFAEALQTRINVLSADFVNRADPAQRSVIGADRQKAVAELARVKSEIQQHQKAITDIEGEARRANVPAGWVR